MRGTVSAHFGYSNQRCFQIVQPKNSEYHLDTCAANRWVIWACSIRCQERFMSSEKTRSEMFLFNQRGHTRALQEVGRNELKLTLDSWELSSTEGRGRQWNLTLSSVFHRETLIHFLAMILSFRGHLHNSGFLKSNHYVKLCFSTGISWREAELTRWVIK